MAYIYEHGDGSTQNPYQIYTPEDLNGVRENLDKCFILVANLDMSSYASVEHAASFGDENVQPVVYATGWIPIGNYHAPFVGTFNGNNQVISNLTFNRLGLSFNGLFGCILDANIYNFTLSNCNLVGGLNTNAVAGYSRNSSIDNVEIDGIVTDVELGN